MNETIKLILSLSLSGSILAVVIFAMRPLIKNKFTNSLQYYIWIVVLFRLVLPFSFETSIMNNLFYGEQASGSISSQSIVLPIYDTSESASNSSISPNVQENVVNGVYNGNADHSRYFEDLFNKYTVYLWLIGVIVSLAVNLSGYARFSKYLKQTNKPASDEQNRMLAALLSDRNNVRLVRNRFVTTPLLIGILRPYIIIPDINFNENQLKYILLHEIAHLKRFDIGVKWLTMIATSIHWYNPLMYFIRKEINHACELACDEAVIKNLNAVEKQAYGDTLISVVAEYKYPLGVLQATMCEEKKSLKERLVAIMNHHKKSRPIIIFSAILILFVIIGALYLGAGVGVGKDTPPNLYISVEESKTKVARTGTYSWSYLGRHTNADSDHPIKFEYKSDNIVSVSGKQQLVIGTQILKLDKKYDFMLEKISVYKDGQLVEFESPDPSSMNGNLYLQAPPDVGEYTYALQLNFKNKGTVNYGFVVRVNMLTYNLTEISKYRTPYVGDNSKVSAIVSHLPAPDSYFKQQYKSMLTDNTNKLNVFYEAKKGASHISEWPIVNPDNATYSNLRKNALVLFCMIDNLDKITFAFCDSQSDGKLDISKYDTTFTFSRASIVEKYGNLSVIVENLDLLYDTLMGENIYVAPEFADEEVAAARIVVDEYFRAIAAKDDKAILINLTPMNNHPNVVLYGEETRTLLSVYYNANDPMRESYIKSGRGGVNGTKKENVIVFKVSFNVKYPKGVSGSFNEGDYKNWSVILVRDDKASPWLIDDQGY